MAILRDECPACGATLYRERGSAPWKIAHELFKLTPWDANKTESNHTGQADRPPCPLEGRLVQLEAKQQTDRRISEAHDKRFEKLEARLEALEQQPRGGD